MGTLVRITVYAPDERARQGAFRAAFDRIRDLDGRSRTTGPTAS